MDLQKETIIITYFEVRVLQRVYSTQCYLQSKGVLWRSCCCSNDVEMKS